VKNVLILTNQENIFSDLRLEFDKEQIVSLFLNLNDIDEFDSFQEYDFVILDLSQRDSLNIQTLKLIQDKTKSPLFVTSSNESEIIKSFYLNQGADGYLTHPIRVIEALAFMKAVHRRIYSYQATKKQDKLVFGSLEIYPNDFRVFNDGVEINLTAKEFALLKLFVENSDSTVSRERISDFIYRMEQTATGNAINIHINRLRKKLSSDENDSLIETVWGVGYRLSNLK
jgi:DNA-binding response OmpR family regulator